MTDRRCCQQDELYRAESAAGSGRVLTLDEAQALVDELRETTYWERNFDRVKHVSVFLRKTNAAGSVGWFERNGYSGVMDMAPCHLTERVICHELAHVLAQARYDSHAHDPWFARTYLELVYLVMGTVAYTELHAAFKDGNVDFEHDNNAPSGVEL